ncbi:MAG: hypothetical protein LBV27_02725 [Oscillospiraceae bacterium]|jgi:hypothetical protein|nr:hypothetical protein [Oscillospiraceae bacterium]
MDTACFDLLKTWCDALLEHQITELKQPELHGALLCPACGHIHGRCADAIYPLLYLADATGDARYLDAAKALYAWTEYNMSRADGSFYNDANHSWRGITVFFSIQLGESLLHHGHLLDAETKNRWTQRLIKAGEFMYTFFDDLETNINYPITLSAAMAVIWKVTGDGRYLSKAKASAHSALKFIAGDGLIFGESHPYPFDHVTEKGGRAVDLGYNVEESLAGLVNYALLTGDDIVLDAAANSMRAHLEFMLADGGWDNSWGSRIAKWTYWGSRTSDGCQTAYALLAHRDPAFAQAAQRNLELYARCTHNGLLHGGPMYESAGEPPCIHHTFCHAKSLAAILRHGYRKPAYMPLPREAARGVRHFPTVNVSLLAAGPWRATVSNHDFEVVPEGNATGGALTMLWHKKAGPVCVAGMTDYQLTEPNNMQLSRRCDIVCQTPRAEYEKDGVCYRSINDKNAVVACAGDDEIIVHASGSLRDKEQRDGGRCALVYTGAADCFKIGVTVDADNAFYYLPIIAASSDTVSLNGNEAVITAASHRIILRCSTKLRARDLTRRNFNPVAGFETIDFYCALSRSEKTEFDIKID